MLNFQRKTKPKSGPATSTPRVRPLLLALTLMLAAGSIARADEVKVGNFWYKDFAVIGYNNGQLTYQIGGNEFSKPLTDFQGFKLAGYPTLEAAEKALDAGNTKDALQHYKSARGRAKEPWLRMWLDSKLFPLMEKEGESLGAVNTFIQLIEAKAPEKFLEGPPIRAARAVSSDDKAKLNDKFKTLRKGATERSFLADSLDEMIDATTAGSEPTPPGTGTGDKLETVIPMPEFMILTKDKPDPITRLLARGKFGEALERVDEDLKTAAGGGRTSLLLYQRGLAQFNIGLELEKEGKGTEASEKFKDAGLSFMRVAIYFRSSPYVGPSLMEAAAVHLKIKRPSLAKPLLDQAGGVIDPDDKPLRTRFEKLVAEQKAAGG